MLVTLGESLTISGRSRHSLGGGDDFIQRARIGAKLQPSLLGVGTGNIQLIGGNALALVEDLDGPLIVFAGVAENVGHHDRVLDAAQVRQLLVEKSLRADVLQADGIQHAGRGFPQTRRRIADHRLLRQSLHHKAAQLAEMDYIFEFNSIAESAAGGDDGILELECRQSSR